MKKPKHLFRWIGLGCLCVLIYEAGGALLPFVHMKKTGETFKESFDPGTFYGGDEDGTDRAVVVETSMDALHTRIEMIHQAKERIILSTFDIRLGESTDDIFSSLIEAADRGVKVQILVDGLYGSVHMNGKPIFYAAGTNPNIEIRFYNVPGLLRPWTINGRMHDKYVIVDDKLLLIGGRNTFDYFLGEYDMDNLSYDRDVLIYNTAHGTAGTYEQSCISQVDDYFQRMWESKYCKTVFDRPSKSMRDKLAAAGGQLKAHYDQLGERSPELFQTDIDYTARTVPIKKATLIYNPTHIYGKEPWVWYQAQYLMEHAKDRAYIHTPYAALSQDMYEGLSDIVDEVPDVTMMLNATSVGDNFMASSDYTLNRNKILDTDVELYEYFGGHSSHGKSILVDEDLSLVGSYNLDMRSTYVDTETMLVIDGEEFHQQLEGHIEALEQDALRVDSDGSYTGNPGVAVKELPPVKKFIFAITSRLFQLFRYLI